MAAKNNIRSIRFSDELAELIDRQVGDTFTQKFENLITRCVWELPQKEKQLASIQADIRREQERLYNLRRATEQLRLLDDLVVVDCRRLHSVCIWKFSQRIYPGKNNADWLSKICS